jgi:hypothetical protein
MPARLVERTGEAVLLIHIPGLVDALLPREPPRLEDKLGLGGRARAVLLRLESVAPEAVAEHADAAELGTGLLVDSKERVVERRLAVGHVEERGLRHAAAAPVVEARDGEAEGGGGALDGGEYGVEEVGRGGRAREEVAASARGKRAAGEDSKLPTPRRESRAGASEASRRRSRESRRRRRW